MAPFFRSCNTVFRRKMRTACARCRYSGHCASDSIADARIQYDRLETRLRAAQREKEDEVRGDLCAPPRLPTRHPG